MKVEFLYQYPGQEAGSQWDDFLREAILPTSYVTRSYFIDPYVTGERLAVIASAQGRVEAIATGTVTKNAFIAGMFSRPQLVFRRGADRSEAVRSIIDSIGQKFGNIRIDLFAWEGSDSGVESSVSGEETSVVMLDLSKGEQKLFSEFSQTRRNELRKAEKRGIIQISELRNTDEAEQLYKIYCDWNRIKGNRPESFEKMRASIEVRESRRAFIAKVGDKVIAGSFYRFCPGGVVEYAANFSMPEFQKYRPNDLIGWHAIQWAASAGFSHFSMGGSHLFLRRFGGDIRQTYRTLRPGRVGIDSLKQNAVDLGLGAYRMLPATVRQGMKKVLARS